jgi:hypothetical protein
MSTDQAPQNDESQNVAQIKWDGEGLPPVGVICEAANPHGDDWCRCIILAWDAECAVFRTEIGSGYPYIYDGLRIGSFRPIRTPEQIAQQERQAAIEEMDAVFSSNFEGHRKDGLQALYDAGYRKP